MARINSVQGRIQGPINRDENLIAHSWFVVLVVGAIIGTFALLVWMFQIGAWSERRGSTVTQTPIVIQQAPPATFVSPAPAQREELTAEDLDRRHSEYLRKRDR